MIRRYALIVGLVAVGMVIATPAAGATSVDPAKAHAAKKRCKRGYVRRHRKCVKARPLPLTAAEVKAAIDQDAGAVCRLDPTCFNYGDYVDYTTPPRACNIELLYTWTCGGYEGGVDEHGPWRCDFRAHVDRIGFNQIYEGRISGSTDCTYF